MVKEISPVDCVIFGMCPQFYIKKASFWDIQYIIRNDNCMNMIKEYDRLSKEMDNIQSSLIAASEEGKNVSYTGKDYFKNSDEQSKVASIFYNTYAFLLFSSSVSMLINEEEIHPSNIIEMIINKEPLCTCKMTPHINSIAWENTHAKDDDGSNLIHIVINFDSPVNLILEKIEIIVNEKIEPQKHKHILNNYITARNIKNILQYKPEGDTSRAIGLWLWERVQRLGKDRGAVIKAIEEFESLPQFNDLEIGRDPSYYHWLKRTEACI